MICATSEATTSTVQPSDTESNHAEDTRVVAVELVIERAEDPDGVVLMKIGDWTFEGPLQGVSLHRSGDGTYSSTIRMTHPNHPILGQINLLHIDGRKHLYKQRVILSRSASGTDSPIPAAGSSTNLPLSNPFKVLKGLKSAENLKDVDDDPLTELSLIDTVDLGLLPLEGLISGIRFDSTDFLASGLAWSEQELLVCRSMRLTCVCC